MMINIPSIGAMDRVGPVPQDRWFTTKHPVYGCAVPPRLWGTLEEIRRFGEVGRRIAALMAQVM